jgi:DNA mismatch repair protein MutH
MELPYNPRSKKSIIEFAKKLKGHSLITICNNDTLGHSFRGKGSFGQILERHYFLYEPNSHSEPDFPLAGIELKSSPLKKTKKLGYKAKERLVLNTINYFDIINQQFETSSFFRKNANILLVFYLYQPGLNILDFVIKLVDTWTITDVDLEIIKNDWETIKNKVKSGRAHELSEGDTLYLGACTKGASSKSFRVQPNSNLQAKQRAFSFKQGYVNHIVASIASEERERYGKLIVENGLLRKKSFNDIILSKFEPYVGKPVSEIIKLTGLDVNLSAKGGYASLVRGILGFSPEKIEEFKKAEIEVKTIRIEKSGVIEQSISFPAFKFYHIYNESWSLSSLKKKIEQKFLFIFLKHNGTEYILEKIRFWNMPFEDRNEFRRVWLKTKKVIQSGYIVKELKSNKSGKILRLNNFPKKIESKVAHVRPHGRNFADTYPLPVLDKMTGCKEFTKQCFWLNQSYVRDFIYRE